MSANDGIRRGGKADYVVRHAVEAGGCHRPNAKHQPPRTNDTSATADDSSDEAVAADDASAGAAGDTTLHLRRGEAYLRELLRASNLRPRRNHVVFAVVRDPVSRFVSSVAQVLGMDGAARRPGREMQRRCRLNSTSATSAADSFLGGLGAGVKGDDGSMANAIQERRVSALRRAVLRCAIDYLKADSSGYGLDVDVHLTPTATRLASYVLPASFDHGIAKGGGNADVAVAVYPMEEVDGLLSALGYSSVERRGGNKDINIRNAGRGGAAGMRGKRKKKPRIRRLTEEEEDAVEDALAERGEEEQADRDAAMQLEVEVDAKNKVGGRDYKAQSKWTHLSPDMREALGGISSRDLDGDMIGEVCRLYAVDVALFRYLGFGAPLCDGVEVTTRG